MKLTERERALIMRRVCGEYAVIPVCRTILHDHRKNRAPEDQLYLEFLRVALAKSLDIPRYEELQHQLLELDPPAFLEPSEPPAPPAQKDTAGIPRLEKGQEIDW